MVTTGSRNASLPLLLLLLLIATCWGKLEHLFLFPPNDEYDHKILDPNTIYGSPYGGFARATRSRLAKLPLILPVASDETKHMTVTDGQGRRFVCRTYSEDEVDESTINNSVFDRVVHKGPSATQELQVEHDSVSIPDAPSTKQISEPERIRIAEDEIKSIMQSLEGVCTQLHQGWWSYEWCAKQYVRQFHIELGETEGQIMMESITGLGTFQKRDVELAEKTKERRAQQTARKLTAAPGDDVHKQAVYDEAIDLLLDPLLGSQKELGRVVDFHWLGALCDATGQPRSTKVEFRCCAPDQMRKMKPFVIYKGIPIPSDIAAIASIKEPMTCTYHLLVCTPLLCEGLAQFYQSVPDAETQDTTAAKAAQNPPAKLRPKKDNESIRETIDRTLEGTCMYHMNQNHWWTYQLCHRKHVRQYHDAQVFDPNTGITSQQLEVEYTLGRYDVETSDGVGPTDEIRYVVNVTELDNPGKVANRGNGAYFYQEYTNGQICSGDDPDVKDKGGTPRSVTVRYYCGPTFAISNVNEDSTCHYIMDVTLPDLCENPLFKKPAEKKQIIKCLPMKD